MKEKELLRASMEDELVKYDFPGAAAFSTMRNAGLPFPVVLSHQVHGDKIAVVREFTEDLDGYDAIVTDVPGLAVGVRTADCVPILLHDSARGVVAAVHSGWKGTVQRIAQKTVMVMQDTFSSKPSDISAVIGPCICAGCFQVGTEVVRMFKDNGLPLDRIYRWEGPKQDTEMAGGHHIDLVEANRWMLIDIGLEESRIHICGICSYTDGRFFSARREGKECGRTVSAIRINAE